MTQIRTIFCVILLLGALTLPAQTGQWEHFTYGGENRSLASYENTVWVGSTIGIVKYDTQTHEKQFIDKTNSPLKTSWISALAVSPGGILWIGNADGLYRVQGDDWQLFNPNNSGLVTNHVSKIICVSDEELWLFSKGNANYDYVYHLEGDDWSAYSSSCCPIGGQVIRDMALDAQGLPWITYYNLSSGTFGISHYEGSSWISQSTAVLGLPAEDLSHIAHDGNRVWVSSFYGSIYSIDAQGAEVHDLSSAPYNLHFATSLSLDSQGKLLLGYISRGGVPYLLRRLPDSWEMLDPNPEVPGLTYPNNIVEDALGHIWFGTNHGMAIYDGTAWSGFDCSSSPLPSNSISGLAVDPQDNIWLTIHDIGEEYNALIKKTGADWLIYDSVDYPLIGEPENLVCGTDQKIWFLDRSTIWGTSIVSFDGTNWQSFNHADSTLPEGNLICFRLDPNNRPWVAMFGADRQCRLYRMEQGNWQEKAITLLSVRDMVFDGAGNPWMATNGGLVHVAGETVIYNAQNSGLPSDNVSCLAYDADRNLWIGTSTGLAKYYSGAWDAWDPQHGNHPNRTITGLEIDQEGRVWCATNNTGVVCFDGTEWTTFMENNSPLMTNRVFGLAYDSQNNLWIRNQGKGITRFNLSTTGINEQTQAPAQQQACLANYPNPFNPSTTISFSLPENGPASLTIYNLKGQVVKELCRETSLPSGEHSVVWNGTDANGKAVSSGVYFARLRTRKDSASLKLLLMK